ncbi:hypothetical protein LEP1GSC170_0641 [Leptospira interrogans serovar Bataviae str. HAI135]|nr:hypothetical protein LEP1GSC170_0641 [Leptospira interrogans serovar Bataviae str. HAI135]
MIANLAFCKQEDNVNVNDILGILLLKQNSQSEGESLGLTIAFSTRFKNLMEKSFLAMNGQRHFWIKKHFGINLLKFS